jgi:radical SAM protein with 4Fe4S-binding SPASM domain
MHIEEVIKEFQSNEDSLAVHNMVSAYDYDHMVYIRLFEGCNLHCEHCFIPSNPKKIKDDFYDNHNVTKQLEQFGKIKEGQKLYLQWHGGEPTLLGVDYLQTAIEKVQSDNRFQYMHGIQTNLFNFDQKTEDWVNLYKKHFDGQLGVSWDYGIRHVKINSLSDQESNNVFENKFWSNIKLAQNAGLDLYMVVTATKVFFEHFTNPFKFFEMMAEKGITKLNFERITKTGYARDAWSKLGLSNAEYSQYMSKFFKAYILFKDNNQDINLSISPFDGLLRSVIGMNIKQGLKEIGNNSKANIWDVLSYKNQGYGCWSGECDTRFHTIDSNGYKHGCTALTSEQDNKKVAIDTKKILWIGSNQRQSILSQRESRQETCQGCEFLSICSSGCLSVEKFDDSGECSGAKTLFKTISVTVKNYI